MNTQTWGPATVLTLILVLAGAVVGAIVVITNPQTLSFSTYLTDLAVFSGAGAVATVGHGILNQPATPPATALPAPTAAATTTVPVQQGPIVTQAP